MEYNLIKQSVPVPGYALNTVSEQPVDIDLTLPDYCPDIERILRCCLIPKVYLSNISGDRLNVEGGACVRVLYLDSEQKCVRSFEYTAPFSESFPLKADCDDCAVYVDTKPEYINCRALSPRKLSLHGAFSLYAKVVVKSALEYCTYEGQDDLQVKPEPMSVSALKGLCYDSFGVQEDIPLGGIDVSSVLSHRLSARITDLKSIRDKLMLNAELKLEVMYLNTADNHEVQCISYSVPVSRVADCSGAGENSVIDARLEVLSYDLRLNDDALGGSSVFALDAKLCLNAMCYEDEDIAAIADVFSTQREVEARCCTLSCDSRLSCGRFTDVGKANVSIEEGIGKVIDIHAERATVTAAVSDGSPVLSAKVGVCVLFENTDAETRYVERDVEFSYRPAVDACDTVVSAALRVDSLSYRILDERSLEVRAELCYDMTAACRLSSRTVCAVTAEDDAPLKEDDGTVVLYYADAGDSVWDISKRFGCVPDDLRTENTLQDDVLSEDMMLIISK